VPGEDEILDDWIACCDEEVDAIQARITGLEAVSDDCSVCVQNMADLENSLAEARDKRNRLVLIRINSQVSSMKHNNKDKVCLGSIPHFLTKGCLDIPDGECVAQVVGLEDDIARGKIQMNGPLGMALRGAKPGDVISHRGGKLKLLDILMSFDDAPAIGIVPA